ncbi:MAG: SDR family NAD(P)-dependent oxidoreductase, partial [Bdellovibrionales bacterium]|nr:SDR family NAD(P)-dependent oxidoreductase [Bdellovibrionales bacterium]
MPIKYDFQEKTALVTGGAQGIGFEITKAFLTAGARVWVWDYNKEALDQMVAELKDFGDKVHTAQVDVTQMESCVAAAQKAENIDVLVNNAGITRDKSLAKMTTEDFSQVISTNL